MSALPRFLRASINDWKDQKNKCHAAQAEDSKVYNKKYWREKEKEADKKIATLEKKLSELIASGEDE